MEDFFGIWIKLLQPQQSNPKDAITVKAANLIKISSTMEHTA